MSNKEELKALIQAAWNDERVKGETFGDFLGRAAEAIIKAGWAKHSHIKTHREMVDKAYEDLLAAQIAYDEVITEAMGILKGQEEGE